MGKNLYNFTRYQKGVTLKNDKLRKQIRFKNFDQLKTIHLAVKITEDKLNNGESISFSSFVRAAAFTMALEVIKDNPDHMKSHKP